MTDGVVQRVAYCRATAVLCHRPHHLKYAKSGFLAQHTPAPPLRRACHVALPYAVPARHSAMPDSRPDSLACQTSMSTSGQITPRIRGPTLALGPRTWRGASWCTPLLQFWNSKTGQPLKRNVGHADSRHLPDSQGANLGKGCKAPRRGPFLHLKKNQKIP